MTPFVRGTLFWLPRVLTIGFILFISMFALDVFEEGLGFWRTIGALFMHLIPTWVLVVMLAVAWKREWVATVVLTALGALFLWWDQKYRHNALSAILMIAGPLFLLALLFLLNWLKHDELRARG